MIVHDESGFMKHNLIGRFLAGVPKAVFNT